MNLAAMQFASDVRLASPMLDAVINAEESIVARLPNLLAMLRRRNGNLRCDTPHVESDDDDDGSWDETFPCTD
jgi:hypothetical protein